MNLSNVIRIALSRSISAAPLSVFSQSHQRSHFSSLSQCLFNITSTPSAKEIFISVSEHPVEAQNHPTQPLVVKIPEDNFDETERITIREVANFSSNPSPLEMLGIPDELPLMSDSEFVEDEGLREAVHAEQAVTSNLLLGGDIGLSHFDCVDDNSYIGMMDSNLPLDEWRDRWMKAREVSRCLSDEDDLERFPQTERRRRINSLVDQFISTRALTAAATEDDLTYRVDPKGVFINHDLRLSDIKVHGFDFDYTLVEYKNDLEEKVFNLARDYLVESLRYPRELLDVKYDPDFAIRGLGFDSSRGFLMRLDMANNFNPRNIFFGLRRAPLDLIETSYSNLTHVGEYQMSSFYDIFDLYSVAESGLLASVIDHFSTSGIEFRPAYVYEDVVSSVRHIHLSGMLHRAVLNDLKSYVQRSSSMLEFMLRLKRANKKTFLLTNSGFSYVDTVMRFLFHSLLPHNMKSWRDLFDVIVVQAGKPDWFGGRLRDFRRLEKDGLLSWETVTSFDPDQVYSLGCFADFERMTGWKGPEILYFGDHLIHDIATPSVQHGWRTCAIIKELEHDIHVQNLPRYRQLTKEMEEVSALANRLHRLTLSDMEEPSGLMRLKVYREALKMELTTMFNPNFGSVFSTSTKATKFAALLERHADIYTSQVTNLLKHPVNGDFLHRRQYLSHDFRFMTMSNSMENTV